MDNSVIAHFSQQASNYDEICNRGFLGVIRRREQRAMSKLLQNYFAGKSVLDLGSGVGMYSRLAIRLGATHSIAVDQVPEMIAQINHPQISGIVADASSFQSPQKVDAILMAGVLEFVDDPIAFMQNARNQVENGSPAGILLPPSTILIRLYQYYHRSHGVKTQSFSKQQLVEMAAQSGWEVEETTLLWPFTLLARLKAI
ncbi:MAG: class I SAM-dependent methyltransferase [Bacteroidales bacterium]|nr:class I SAM-dependent methyltransferase [Bacteroidales bacterium]